MRSLQAVTKSSDTRRATFAQCSTLGSHSQPECDKLRLHVCPSFSARSCLSQIVIKAWKRNFHPRFSYSKRSLWSALGKSNHFSFQNIRSMNKDFILSITNGFCVKYGPSEASPHFFFYLQKIILSWGSQFSCVFSVVSTAKQPLSWVASPWLPSVQTAMRTQRGDI